MPDHAKDAALKAKTERVASVHWTNESATMKTMTDRQRQVVTAVEVLTATRGIPPSIGEVARVLGTSKTRAHGLAMRAVRAGVLTYEPRVARSWRLSPRKADE